MALQYLIIVFGALLIAGFIINGFYRGRHNRTPLERDSRTEAMAQELSQTTNTITEKIGAVEIVDASLSEKTVSAGDLNPEINVNSNNKVEQDLNTELELGTANYSAQNSNKKTIWGSIKKVFGSKGENASEDVIEEPQNQYFISVQAKEGDSFLARDVDAICREYNLQLRERDIYYHNNEGRTVFGICGNTEPYGFSEEYLDHVKYEILNFFMDLPDRGFAENSYVEMVSFAYIITQHLGGKVVNENHEPIDENVVNRMREILAQYDHLA